MECTPVGQSTPAVHGLKKLYKENKLQIAPLPTSKEVVYAFIITRGARTNTHLMDSAHQRYRLTHYNCFIHISPQLHTVHTKGIGLFTTISLIY